MQNDAHADPELTTEVVDGIPVLACVQRDTRRKPLVILSHGFRGNKEGWTPHLQTLAGRGCHAVALDNRNHGARQEPDFVSQVFEGGRLKVHEVRRLIKETADDVSRLIDHFSRAGGIDRNRIGVCGVSMGGFATFRALVIEKRITVAAPIIASPYWDDVPQGVPVAEDSDSRQALDRISQESSPALFPERFFPRPLLIQIGSEDRHYDGGRVREFAERLRSGPYRDDAPRLRLIVHEGVGHECTSDMWAHVLAWFDEYL